MHDYETKTTMPVPDEQRGLGYDALQHLVEGGATTLGVMGAGAAVDTIKDHFAKDDSDQGIVLPPGVDDPR